MRKCVKLTKLIKMQYGYCLSRSLPLCFRGTAYLFNFRRYLHYNYISSVKPEMFVDLVSLERLFLHNNKIERIPSGTFDNLKALNRL
jgi:Leucine-rich repeat (LRR) protein